MVGCGEWEWICLPLIQFSHFEEMDVIAYLSAFYDVHPLVYSYVNRKLIQRRMSCPLRISRKMSRAK